MFRWAKTKNTVPRRPPGLSLLLNHTKGLATQVIAHQISTLSKRSRNSEWGVSRSLAFTASKRCYFSLLRSRINSDEGCLLLYAGFVQVSKPGFAVRLVHSI